MAHAVILYGDLCDVHDHIMDLKVDVINEWKATSEKTCHGSHCRALACVGVFESLVNIQEATFLFAHHPLPVGNV